MKHMELIATYCDVLATCENRAIWYVDGGYKYADVLEDGEGWVSYSCDTREMWEMLCGKQGIFFIDFWRAAHYRAGAKFIVLHRPGFCQAKSDENCMKIFFLKCKFFQ